MNNPIYLNLKKTHNCAVRLKSTKCGKVHVLPKPKETNLQYIYNTVKDDSLDKIILIGTTEDNRDVLSRRNLSDVETIYLLMYWVNEFLNK